MDITVGIATYNRAHMLADTLSALGRQETPGSLAWEIVVVDNNSCDSTAEVVDTFAKRASNAVRYLFEPRQGVSHARNRCVQESRSSAIAFTDDDVLPAPGWVAAIARAMNEWRADGVGGRILPQWGVQPPQWLVSSRRLRGHLALMEFEEAVLLAFPMRTEPQVWGANMAFRRELFEQVGLFNPRWGPVGKKLYRGEEVELINRALQRGLRIVYDPAPTVFHRIGGERLRKGHFRRWAYDSGEGVALARVAESGRGSFGAPRWLYRIAAAWFREWLVAAVQRRPDAFELQLDFLSELGQLAGYWKAWERRRASVRGTA